MPQANAAKTASDLVRLIERSGILSLRQMEDIAELAQQAPSAGKLARRLIAKSLLTRWQASQLLAGWHKLQIGKYRLCDQLDRSETGRVFLAEHVQLDRPVAIKTLAIRHTRDSKIVAQFLEAARALSQLDHGNILHVFDVDQEGDQYYLVMEYIEGDDLQQLVAEQGPLAHDMVIEIVRQAATGLAYLHGRGVIHRDMRPANVMLDEHGQVKLIGLGTSLLTSACPEPEDEHATVPAACPGVWTAPEQACGKSTMDSRADFYGLGCIAHWLLTGQQRNAHADESEHQRSVSVTESWVERPVSADNVPRDLIRAIDRMCSTDPADRFQTAEEIIAALAPLVDHPGGVAAAVASDETIPEPVAAAPRSWDGVPGDAQCTGDGTALPLQHPTVDFSAAATTDTDEPVRSTAEQAVDALVKDRPARPNRVRIFPVVGGVGIFLVVVAVCSIFAVVYRQPDRAPKAVTPRRVKADLPVTPKAEPQTADMRQKPRTTESSMPEAGAATGKNRTSNDPNRRPPPRDESEQKKRPTPSKEKPAEKTAPSPDSAPVTKKRTTAEATPREDPFQELPPVYALPSPEDGDGSAMRIGPVALDSSAPCNLSVHGGSTAGTGEAHFRIVESSGEGSRHWNVVLATPGSATVELVAQVAILNHQLTVQWLPEAQQTTIASHLVNCVLRLRSGSFHHDLRLRKPVFIHPLLINLKKSVIESELKVVTPPNLAQIRFAITSIEPPLPQDYACAPDHPVTVPRKPEAPVWIGMVGDASALKFQVAPSFRPVPGGNGFFLLRCTACFQLKADLPAQPITPRALEQAEHAVEVNQLFLNAAAQHIRQTVGRLKRQDPKRQKEMNKLKRAEAELAKAVILTDKFEALQQLRKTLADGALIHYRVFFLADDCEVDLLRSDVAQQPE